MSIRFKSHQRSWWFVHNRPTQKALSPGPESHQRSWWIVHIQPGFDQSQSGSDRRVRLRMNNPPTALVGFGDEWRRSLLCRLSMNEPPTALVGLSAPDVRAVAFPFRQPARIRMFGESVGRLLKSLSRFYYISNLVPG